MKPYVAGDGTAWGVEVRMPTHSSALVIFRHPDGATSRKHRYAQLNVRTASASDPRGSLGAKELVDALDTRSLARLFNRSAPVDTVRERYIVS
jgi:hypothetical protein